MYRKIYFLIIYNTLLLTFTYLCCILIMDNRVFFVFCRQLNVYNCQCTLIVHYVVPYIPYFLTVFIIIYEKTRRNCIYIISNTTPDGHGQYCTDHNAMSNLGALPLYVQSGLSDED